MSDVTTYAGETLQLTLVPKDFDGTVMTDTDVLLVDVIGYNEAGTAVLPSSAMTWDAVDQMWTFIWETTGLGVGPYEVRFTVTDLAGRLSWEWRRVRLLENPAPAP
jgi:hypothetical protein